MTTIALITTSILAAAGIGLAIWKHRAAEKANDSLQETIGRIHTLRKVLEETEHKLLVSETDVSELKAAINSYHDHITDSLPYGTPIDLKTLRRILFATVAIEYEGGGMGEPEK
jgi:hypothetical protein